jgi:predicted AlkP superfamily pyrophosphatase or phosphodiesterase
MNKTPLTSCPVVSKRRQLPVLLAAVFLVLLSACSAKKRAAEHVFIVSFDGGKPAVIAESEMPHLKKLAEEGAVTWAARTIFPPKTLPSHTSMFTGLTPAKHRVLWNAFEPERGVIKAPTVFAQAKTADPGLSTALFAGKVKFQHLRQPGSLDLFYFNGANPEVPVDRAAEIENVTVPAVEVARAAAEYIQRAKPNLCGIHFPDADSAGHAYGWGSPEQKTAFREADQALGIIVEAIRKAGIAETSVVLITADHGGHGRSHGENIPDDMEIPWLAWGAGVRSGYRITGPVTTVDTTATALWLLGVPRGGELDGKPVEEAFKK